jgi:type II secretory pathway pseudopilin PulG
MVRRSHGSRRRLRTAGLTLVESALLVALVGGLLAIFVPTFFRHIRTSKAAEAGTELQRLHGRAAAYFAATHTLEDGSVGRRCLPTAAGPAPAEPSQDRVQVDFHDPATPGHETWRALGYQPEGPIRYRYTFIPERAECGQAPAGGRTVLLLRAEADLDGDGQLSLYERRATIDADGQLVPVGALYVQDRME